MAWSAADVPAADVTRADNDNVLIVGDHILTATLTDARWNTDGNLATADNTNASFPIRYCYDRRLDTPTRRTTAATTSWLIFDRGTGTLNDFDVVMIGGHNFADITVTQVDLVVSDAADIAGDATSDLIYSWSTASEWANNKRLVTRDLRERPFATPSLTFADANPDTITRAAGDFTADGFTANTGITILGSTSNDGTYTIDTGGVTATVLTLVGGDALAAEGPVTAAIYQTSSSETTNRRFTGVRYLGLKITSSGSETPEVGELWIGKRLQMHTREMLPYAGDMFGVNYSEFRSENRSVVRSTLASGFINFQPSFIFKDATLTTETDTFLSQINYGGFPYLYLHEPNTDRQNCAVVFDDGIRFTDTGGTVGTKTLSLDIKESAPFYTSES